MAGGVSAPVCLGLRQVTSCTLHVPFSPHNGAEGFFIFPGRLYVGIMDIKIVEDSISIGELKKMAEETFGDMVKAVVNVKKGIMAVGGEMHADAEKELLGSGSRQEDLWGVNLHPGNSREEMIVFESLINIRPAQGNRQLGVKDEELRENIADVVYKLVR